MKYAWLLFALAQAASAQFAELAATADGGQLYFSSTAAKDGDFGRKLLIYSDGAVSAFRSGASGPSVSADGSVLGFTQAGQGVVLGAAAAVPLGTPVRVSPDGRFVLGGDVLVDLATQAQTRVAGAAGLANNGIVLTRKGNGLAIWMAGVSRDLAVSDVPVEVQIDPGASVVLYTTAAGRLLAYDVAEDTESLLVSDGAAGVHSGASGTVALYRRHRQAFLIQTDGTGATAITNDPDGITEATLSLDGRVVYAITGAGRLLRIWVADKRSEEILPRTPAITRAPADLVAGSLAYIQGSALDGVTIGGVPAVIVDSTSSSGLLVQVPWETRTGDTTLLPDPAAEWVGGMKVPVVERDPWPVIPYAVHATTGRAVTKDDPALGGETVQLFLSGLGAVSPALPTGVVPQSEIYTVNKPVTCDGGDVLWAGLAPGMLGTYRVDVRIGASITTLRCEGAAVSMSYLP